MKKTKSNGWNLNSPDMNWVVSSSAIRHGKIFRAKRRAVLQVPLHALFSTPLAMESLFPFGRVLTNLDHLRSELSLQGLCRKLSCGREKASKPKSTHVLIKPCPNCFSASCGVFASALPQGCHQRQTQDVSVARNPHVMGFRINRQGTTSFLLAQSFQAHVNCVWRKLLHAGRRRNN